MPMEARLQVGDKEEPRCALQDPWPLDERTRRWTCGPDRHQPQRETQESLDLRKSRTPTAAPYHTWQRHTSPLTLPRHVAAILQGTFKESDILWNMDQFVEPSHLDYSEHRITCLVENSALRQQWPHTLTP